VAGTPYNGLASNVAIPGSVNILSSTAANPTVISTVAAHGMRTGDFCDITDHAVNTGANGFLLPVTVVDTTHFSIPTDTHTYAAGGNTGFVWPQNFTGNNTLLPANSDPFSAATYIPAAACEADRTSMLLLNNGIWRLANGNIGGTAVATDPTFVTTWARIKRGAGGGSALNAVLNAGGTAPFGSLLRSGPIPVGGSASDIIELELDFSWQIDNTGSDGTQTQYFALNCAYYVPGTASPTFTQEAPQSAKRFILPLGSAVGGIIQGSGASLYACFSVRGNLTLQGAGATDSAGLLDVQLFAGQTSGAAADAVCTLLGDAVFSCKVWRPNFGIKQET
jgi:hypothetical protein